MLQSPEFLIFGPTGYLRIAGNSYSARL